METKHTTISGFPGYAVNQVGEVISTSSNWRGLGSRVMRHTLNADGYPSVRLIVSGRRKRLAVHRLVALAFLPPKPSLSHEIRHLDGDRLNPHSINLAWGSRAENAADRELHGRTSRGERHSLAIIGGLAGRFT